MEEGNNN